MGVAVSVVLLVLFFIRTYETWQKKYFTYYLLGLLEENLESRSYQMGKLAMQAKMFIIELIEFLD